MKTILTMYVIYAAVVLIWSSLNHSDVGLRHLVISAALLKEGLVLGSNPIVIELRPVQLGLQPVTSISDALVVSRPEFSSLVHWIPPGATLVFCERGEGCHLDSRVEQALLELGISAVYRLDLHTDYEPTHTSAETSTLSAKS
jgi:hypothetical protein